MTDSARIAAFVIAQSDQSTAVLNDNQSGPEMQALVEGVLAIRTLLRDAGISSEMASAAVVGMVAMLTECFALEENES